MDSPTLGRISRTRSASSASSTLIPQESLINMSSKFGGRTPVRIYFLDNSSKMFLLESNSTVLDVIKMILHKLDISGRIDIMAQYFSLYESLNGSTIDSTLDFDVKVYDVISKWVDENESKLVFMIRLFVPSTWGIQYKDVVASRLGQTKDTLTLQAHLEAAEIIDSQLLHIQYNQCVYNVITGQYPTTPELALELGVYHFIYKFGAYDELRHPLGFLSNRIVEFLPFSHLRGGDIQEWEEKLLRNVGEIQNSHSALIGKKNFDPQRRYVETVMLRLSSCYGCSFFRCSQTQFTTLPNDLYVSIHRQGLNLVEKGRSRQVLRQFHLQELHRWGYKPGIMFYFEAKLDGKELSTVEFGTRDGMTMTHLLTDYVQAFMQESELEKARGIAPPSPNNDSETPKVANKTAPHTPLSPPVLTKSNSLPPPPPPPRPASTSIQKQSVASIPSSSTQLSTPTLQKNKQLSKSSSLGPQYTAKHHQCAVKIQSLFRGFSLRNEWIKEDAAILIQAIYRGYAERCRVALMLEELFHSGQLELLDD